MKHIYGAKRLRVFQKAQQAIDHDQPEALNGQLMVIGVLVANTEEVEGHLIMHPELKNSGATLGLDFVDVMKDVSQLVDKEYDDSVRSWKKSVAAGYAS